MREPVMNTATKPLLWWTLLVVAIPCVAPGCTGGQQAPDMAQATVEAQAAVWAERIRSAYRMESDELAKELRRSAGPQTVPILIRLMDYPSPPPMGHTILDVAARALDKALADEKTPVDPEAIVSMLCESRFRGGYASALLTRRPAVLQALVSKATSPSAKVRRRVYELLGGAPGMHAAEVLWEAFHREKDPQARRAALNALASKVSWLRGAFLEAINDPDPGVRVSAARGIVEFNAGMAADSLARRLDDPDAEVRAAAAHALGYVRGADRHATALLRATHDAHSRVRVHAVITLGFIQHRVAIARMLEMLEEARPETLRGVVAGLRRFKDPRVTKALLTLVGHETLTKEAILSLRDGGDPEAGAPLLDRLEDLPEDMRSLAGRAVLTILARNHQRLSTKDPEQVAGARQAAIALGRQLKRGPLAALDVYEPGVARAAFGHAEEWLTTVLMRRVEGKWRLAIALPPDVISP